MNRRNLLKHLALVVGGCTLSEDGFAQSFPDWKKGKSILLCTGIQFGNIGDGGHVTGILNLLNTYLPGAKIILWPRINLSAFDEMILRNWPDVEIVHGDLVDGKPDNSRIEELASRADFLIGGHGETKKISWAASQFDKPYGIIGVTVSRPPTGSSKEFVDNAAFYFTRETASYENLRKAGVTCPAFGFAPDATFGSNVQDTLETGVCAG